MVLNTIKATHPLAKRSIDDTFGPLFPRIVGFDDVFNVMDKFFDNGLNVDVPSYPPYNYIKMGDNKWQLEFAVAGFNRDELTVELDKNLLMVKGSKDKSGPEEADKQYVFRSFSQRQFKTIFTVQDGVEVENCEFVDGVLTITLVKPHKDSEIKRIEIK